MATQQEVINQVNQLSRQIKPIADQLPVATGGRQQELANEYQRLNTQRNALLSSVPGLKDTYESGIHGYLYVHQNQKPLPDEGLSYDDLQKYARAGQEASAKNTYTFVTGSATGAKASESYRANVAKTEGIQVNPDTLAVEAKSGYQLNQRLGQVSRNSEATTPKPLVRNEAMSGEIIGVNPNEGKILLRGENEWRDVRGWSWNNRELNKGTLEEMGKILSKERKPEISAAPASTKPEPGVSDELTPTPEKQPEQKVKFLLSPKSGQSLSSDQITGPEPGTIVEPELREVIKTNPAYKAAADVLVMTGKKGAAPASPGQLAVLAVLTTLAASYEIAKVVKNYREETNTLPSPQDVVVVTKDGQAFGIIPESLKDTGYHPLTPPAYPQAKESFTTAKEMPRLEGMRAADIQRTGEGIRALQPEAVVFTTPAIRPEELTGQTAGLMLAQAKTQQAANQVKQAVPATIPIDWNKILEDANKAKTKESVARAFAPATDIVRQPDYVIYQDAYNRNLKQYLARRMALEAAKRSYILFVNPHPVKGTLNEQSLSAIAGYKLAHSLGSKNATSTSLEQALAQSNVTQSAVKVGQLAYTAAKDKGMTDSQAVTKANQAIQSAVRTSLRQSTATNTATRVATKTAIQQATGSATRTATNTATKTATRDLTRTRELTRTAELTATGIPILNLKKKDAPDEKKWTKADISSATAFRMGALGKPPKPVTIALRAPYGPGDKKVFVGETPEGLHVSPNATSAKKTIQLLHGKSPANVTTRIGFQTVRISRPSRHPGVRGAISFRPERSERVGRMFRTRVVGGNIYSRRPIKYRRPR